MKNRKRGVITLELLIAFTIFILNLTAIMLLWGGGGSIYLDSEINREMIVEAENQLFEARRLAKLDFNSVNSSKKTQVSDPISFVKELQVAEVDLFVKKVSSIVSLDSLYKKNTVKLTTLIIDEEGAKNGGDTCSFVPTGDWEKPEIKSYELGKELLGDAINIFPVSDIQVFNKTLYLAIKNATSNTLPTFFILDLGDSTSKPLLLDSFDNNPAVKTGFNSLAIAGRYGYLASAYSASYSTCAESLSCSQLQVVDLKTMSIVGKLKIPGVTGMGGQAIGTKVFYRKEKVYLGLAKTGSGPEFNIIDVENPNNPKYLGGVSIGNGVNDILVRGDIAYVASPNNDELKIIDVSDPKTPKEITHFDAPLGGGNNGNGKSLALVGNTLHLGRTLLAGDELFILDVTDPESNPGVLASKNIMSPSGNNTSLNGLVVRDNLLYLLTNQNLQILKVDPDKSPYEFSEYAVPLPTPSGQGTALACERNFIYFSSVPTDDKGYLSIVKASS